MSILALAALTTGCLFGSDRAGGPAAESDEPDVEDSGEQPVEGAPSVQITAPSAGDFVQGRSEVTADATDDVGVVSVQFFVDGAQFAVDDSAPFEVDWVTNDFDEGPHTLRALAIDTDGLSGTDEVDVTIDRTDPEVQFATPRNRATVGGVVSVRLLAEDEWGLAEVRLYAAPDTHVLAGDYTFDWDTTGLSKGDYLLQAWAVDNVGREVETEVSVTVDQPPAISITSHSDGGAFSAPGTVEVAVSDDGSIEEVVYAIDGSTKHTSERAPWSWEVDSCIATGTFTLSVEATDDAGNSTSSSITLTASDVAPAVSFTSPSDGGSITGTDELAADVVDDSGVVWETWYVDGTQIASFAISRPSSYTAEFDTIGCYMSDGTHTVRFVAEDGCGQTGEDSVSFTISDSDACCDTGDLDPACF